MCLSLCSSLLRSFLHADAVPFYKLPSLTRLCSTHSPHYHLSLSGPASARGVICKLTHTHHRDTARNLRTLPRVPMTIGIFEMAGFEYKSSRKTRRGGNKARERVALAPIDANTAHNERCVQCGEAGLPRSDSYRVKKRG